MAEILISLGSGCMSAQILDEIGLRKQSLPFDWLWNLDGGLELVANIINDDFIDYGNREKLVRGWHYRWNNQVLIHSSYPEIAHIHSDPLANNEDFLTLLRRVKRFKELLNGKDKIVFIYFRSFSETNHNKVNEEYNLNVCFERLLKESNEFVELIKIKYPSLSFKLLSICLIPRDLNLKKKILKQNLGIQDKGHLEIEIGYEEKHIKIYKNLLSNILAHNSWITVFYKKKYIGVSILLITNIKFIFKSILKYKLL